MRSAAPAAAAARVENDLARFGEIAADPLGALALAALGIDTLSVPVNQFAAVRQALAAVVKTWHLLPHDPGAVERLAREMSLPPVVAQLLLNRGVEQRTEKKPVMGLPAFSFAWNDAKWLFKSQQNLDAFAAGPAKYAPAFNGYCTY